jgi:inorganic triphosphatase YgiF
VKPSAEIEVKLEAGTPGVLAAVLKDDFLRPFRTGEVVRKELDAFYMDTRDLRLAAVRTAYRCRREGNVWKATLKRGKQVKYGVHVRDEWEVKIEKPIPDFSVFDDAGLGNFLAGVTGGRPLVVLFEVRVERDVLNLLLPDGTVIELAADTGEIICHDLREPICEIELELKEGKSEGLIRLMEEFKKRFPLEPGNQSKFARGMKLLEKRRELPLETASRVFVNGFGC